MADLSYPECIKSELSYKRSIDLDSLIEQQDIYVVRIAEKPFNDVFHQIDDENILREDAINPQEILNLSLNLLGGLFEVKHNKFRALGTGADSWDGLSFINLGDYEFTVLEFFTCIYIHINSIHNVKIPYPVPNNKDYRKIISNFYSSVGSSLPSLEEDEITVFGSSKFSHDPTNLNYWHAVLDLVTFQEDVIPRKHKSKAWVEYYCKRFITDYLIIKCYSDLPDLVPIPAECYIK